MGNVVNAPWHDFPPLLNRNSRDNAPCGLWKLLNIFVCEEES